MIAVRAPDGTLDVYLRADEAGAVQHAITKARPGGSAATPDGRVRVHVSVHVSADVAPASEHHEAIDAKEHAR